MSSYISVSKGKVVLTGHWYYESFRLTSSYPKDIDATNVTGSYNAVYGDNRNNRIWLNGNDYSGKVYAGKGNDTIYGGYGTGGRTFYHYRGDGYDTIFQYTSNDAIRLQTGSLKKAWISGDDVVLQLDTGGFLLKDARGVEVTLFDAVGNRTKTVYDVDNTPSGSIPAAFRGGSGGVKLPKNVEVQDGRVVLGAKFANTFDLRKYGDSVPKTIDASGNEKSLVIKGDERNNIIYGSEGGSKLYGYGGNDTLYGGSDGDVFYYGTGDGKDVIRNFQSGEDVVRLYKGTVDSFTASGKNVVLGTSGNGSITLASMAGKRVDVVNTAGAKTAYWIGKQASSNKLSGADIASVLVGGKKADTLTAGNGNAKLYGQDGNDTLIGGKGRDYLEGGKGNDSLFGGNGNDTLYGGRGNDTLNGGTGKDIFLYSNGDGKDVIFSYTDAQAVKVLSGSVSRMYAGKKHTVSGKGTVQDVVLVIGSGSVTLKDVGTQTSFNIINSEGKKKTYAVSSLSVK